MGDEASLDEFFAKKDKSKKKKSKSKFTAADLLPGGEENESKEKSVKKKKKAKEKSDSKSGGENADKTGNGDDEWIEIEEDEKDYTGLRIQNLQISAKEEGESDNVSGEEDNEGGDGKAKDGGVWAVQQQTAEHIPEPEPEPIPTPKEEPTPVSSGPQKYIPPSMRGAQKSQDSSSENRSVNFRGRKKEAPNIQSNLDFPTLGGGVQDAYMSKGRSSGEQFETVRTGNRQLEDPKIQHSRLEVGNKFAALAD